MNPLEMFGGGGNQQAMQPQQPKPLPMVQSPQGKRPKQRSGMPSFMGTETLPASGQLGQKTLLGQ